MRLSKQTYILAGICLMDLCSTVWLLQQHGAAEANPLMSYFLAQGVFAFAIAKITLTIVPLGTLEWAKRRRPVFVNRSLNAAVGAYMLFYIFGVMNANGGPSVAEATRIVNADPERVMVWSQIKRAIDEKRVRKLVPGFDVEQTASVTRGVMAGKSAAHAATLAAESEVYV
jgi:hypothetical protein